MTDFGEMAKKAKAERDARNAVEAQKAKEEDGVRSAFVDKAISALESEVLPLLNKATAEFAALNIESKITTHYDVRNRSVTINPSITFHCLSPRRPSDGYQMETFAAFFSSDGSKISVGCGSAPYDRQPKVTLGTAELGHARQYVSDAIQKVVEAYYKMLDEHGHALR